MPPTICPVKISSKILAIVFIAPEFVSIFTSSTVSPLSATPNRPMGMKRGAWPCPSYSRDAKPRKPSSPWTTLACDTMAPVDELMAVTVTCEAM